MFLLLEVTQIECWEFCSGYGQRQPTPLAFPLRVLYGFQPLGQRPQASRQELYVGIIKNGKYEH